MTASALAPSSREPALPEPCLVWQVRDGSSLLGGLVIDRLVAGRACGGIRISPAVTLGELSDLASVMTLKFAFFGIACGGAKAGIIVPEDATTAERDRRTGAFGAALAPLARFGTYIPGTDLGCSERDLWEVLAGTGRPAGAPPARTLVETSETAVCSGRSAAIAALAALGGQSRGASLAVLGYGRVGAALAARFTAAGGRLVAVSTARGAVTDPAGLSVARLERARAHHGEDAPLHYPGGRQIDAEEMLALAVDVLAPCATTGVVDGRSARRVRCRVVSPGANAAVTLDAERVLRDAGITVIPDFVANAGGILVSHFWPLPLPASAIEVLLERRFRAIVETLLARAAAERVSPAELARVLAHQNLARLALESETAVRHEHLIARLARSRMQRVLPRALLTAIVARVARTLGPGLGAAEIEIGAPA